MKHKGFVDLKFAKVDTDRQARRGFSEAIYCENKSAQQITKILQQLIRHKQKILFLTRLDREKYSILKSQFPKLKYCDIAKIGFLNKKKIKNKKKEGFSSFCWNYRYSSR